MRSNKYSQHIVSQNQTHIYYMNQKLKEVNSLYTPKKFSEKYNPVLYCTFSLSYYYPLKNSKPFTNVKRIPTAFILRDGLYKEHPKNPTNNIIYKILYIILFPFFLKILSHRFLGILFDTDTVKDLFKYSISKPSHHRYIHYIYNDEDYLDHILFLMFPHNQDIFYS